MNHKHMHKEIEKKVYKDWTNINNNIHLGDLQGLPDEFFFIQKNHKNNFIKRFINNTLLFNLLEKFGKGRCLAIKQDGEPPRFYFFGGYI